MLLPDNIKELFFDTLHGDKSVLEFEQRLYADKQLESILSAGDYLELISYDYKSDHAKYGLYNLLEKHVDKGEYEKWRLRKLLSQALLRDKELPNILITFYNLYCKGYNFLDNLGIGYGLAVEVPNSKADYWYELTAEEQQNLLDSFYPQINVEIEKVISWLDNEKVILTGQKDEYDYFKYIDKRTEEDKKPTAYQIARGQDCR